MSYGFENQIQHSVTTAFFFARVSVKALSLWPFCKNLIKLRTFGFFLVRRMRVEQQNQPEISCPSWKNSNWSIKVAPRSLWWWVSDDTMSRTKDAESRTWARGQLKCELQKRRKKCRTFVRIMMWSQKKKKRSSPKFYWFFRSELGVLQKKNKSSVFHFDVPYEAQWPCHGPPKIHGRRDHCPPSRRPCQELVFLSGTGGSIGKRGDGRWSQEWEAIHKQNWWKCWVCETKGAERSPSYC